MTRPGSSRRTALGATVIAAALSAAGCGYNLTSKGSNLPAHVKSIGVPEFRNSTARPELAQRITENIRNELVARGKYDVSSETRGVNAILRGSVLSWTTRPVELSDEHGDAERVAVTLEASVAFEDRVLDRVTWRQEAYRFTSEYDVHGDPDEYFDTELGAVEEVAEDFARAVVSAILQGF